MNTSGQQNYAVFALSQQPSGDPKSPNVRLLAVLYPEKTERLERDISMALANAGADQNNDTLARRPIYRYGTSSAQVIENVQREIAGGTMPRREMRELLAMVPVAALEPACRS